MVYRDFVAYLFSSYIDSFFLHVINILAEEEEKNVGPKEV